MDRDQPNKPSASPSTKDKADSDDKQNHGSQGQDSTKKQGDSDQKQNGNGEEEPVTTLKAYVEELDEQDRLERHLSSKLDEEGSKFNKCTYNEAPKPPCCETGYIFQQVFSCRTCYEELVRDRLINYAFHADALPDLKQESEEFKAKSKDEQRAFLIGLKEHEFKDKYKLPPHGFCLGCMLTCHKEHEINELYSRLAFRCDCGNSSLLEECQLESDKEYSNPKNAYSQNFYDLYCHCSQPHEAINTDTFMIQCYGCEDWFHNSCLQPKETSGQIDDKYFLVCRTCTAKANLTKLVLAEYSEFIFQPQLDFLRADKSEDTEEEEPPRKRQRTGETEANPEKKVPEIDLIMDQAIIEALREEDKPAFDQVIKMFQAVNNISEEEEELEDALQGRLKDDAKSESSSKSKGINSVMNASDPTAFDTYMAQMLEKTLTQIQGKQQQQPEGLKLRTGMGSMIPSGQLSHESQMYIATQMGVFKEKLRKLLESARDSKEVITSEKVKHFFKDITEERKKGMFD